MAETDRRARPDGSSTDAAVQEEQALVEQARDSADAFAELYERYLPRIHAFAYRRSGSQAIAEDVTSATFERALRNLDKFRWQGGGFGAWLYRIASNELSDHYRREARDRSPKARQAAERLQDGDDDQFADVERDQSASDGHLLSCLSELNPRYQRAISLRFLAGLSHEDAAEAMGVSKPVMAVTLHRALKSLKKAVDRRGLVFDGADLMTDIGDQP